MSNKPYDFEDAWNHLLAIKAGGGGEYGFDKFFISAESKAVAKFMLAEQQPDGVYAVFCEDFFVEEIDTKNEVAAKKTLKGVLDDIVARRGEWK